MNPSAIMKGAANEGLRLTLTQNGNIRFAGAGQAVKRWMPIIQESKPEIIEFLKNTPLTASAYNIEAFGERAAIIEANEVPREWAEGYAKICTMPRPEAFNPLRWQQLVEDGGQFLDQWGAQAVKLEWRALDVFGVHPLAPSRRYDCMGLVPLIDGSRVIAITKDTARIDCGGGTTQTFYRHQPTDAAVAIWTISK